MKTPKKNGLEIYKSKGEIRWRIYRQGRVIAASSEGYERLIGALRNLDSVKKVLLTYGEKTAAIINFTKKK